MVHKTFVSLSSSGENYGRHIDHVLLCGFGTNRLRRHEAMKTIARENPNHGVAVPRNRAHGAAGQNRSRSTKWAAKQEQLQPQEMCFFLTFIELIRRDPPAYGTLLFLSQYSHVTGPLCKQAESW
jgi:ribosomal protein L37E